MNNITESLGHAAWVHRGDLTRLQRALAKARRGEPVRVGVIGGSITEGASAVTEAQRWGNRVAQWWKDTFPKVAVDFVNAGIGATGSDIGCHRVAQHLLRYPPDLVVAEYAMNDVGCPLATETMEGLTRQILTHFNQPALMLLFLMNEQGTNVQDRHEPVGRHYGLPMVSFRDALWPEVQAGRLLWADFEADSVHPNSRGHGYCAQFVTAVLQNVLDALPPDSQIPPVPALPAPLVSDVFQFTALRNGATLIPHQNEGWMPIEVDCRFGPGWQASTPGSTMAFEVDGAAISLVFYRVKGALGMIEAQVDDLPPVRMDAWFDGDWGGYPAFQLIARDLTPGPHRLRVELLEEKNTHSGGHLFQIQSVLEAGRKHK